MGDPRTPSRSIREPGVMLREASLVPIAQRSPVLAGPLVRVDPSGARLVPVVRPVRPVIAGAEHRFRPNPSPLRMLLGLAGLASAAAFTTAMLPTVIPQADASAGQGQATDPGAAAGAQPDPSVRHVTRYVTLAPGQTAPPSSTVVVRPQPTPRVTVKTVTRTRQSGKP